MFGGRSLCTINKSLVIASVAIVSRVFIKYLLDILWRTKITAIVLIWLWLTCKLQQMCIQDTSGERLCSVAPILILSHAHLLGHRDTRQFNMLGVHLQIDPRTASTTQA